MVNTTHCIRFLRMLLIMCSTLSCSAFAAQIQVHVDRNNIALNESFTLTFSTDSSTDEDPDFSPLQKDFEIIDSSRNSSTQIVNGQISRSESWTLVLFPKRSGTLPIPPLHFGSDSSPPGSIQVNATQQNTQNAEPIYLEVDAEPKHPYVQAEILFNVRLLHSVDIQNASLSEPELSPGDVLVKKLSEDKRYETWRNNRRYQVYERQYAFYPQKSGELVLPALHFSAFINTRNRGFFDPLGGSGQRIRLRSEPITLHVKPIPASFQGQHWLPAKAIHLRETWAQEPPVFRVGEPVTRSITLSAQGLTAVQIPELPLPLSDHFKAYPDQPYTEDQMDDNGITGMRQEKIALIPLQAGHYTLPAIQIPWWNTRTQQMEIAHIEARDIQVQPAISANPQQTEPRSESTHPAAQNNPSTSQATRPAYGWQIATLMFAVLWLFTLLLWWRRRRQTTTTAVTKDRAAKPPESARQLKEACENNHAHAAKAALMRWQPQQKNFPPDLQQAIDHLNSCLYSQQPLSWNGQALWQAWQQYNSIQDKHKNAHQVSELEPLHRI